MQQKLDTSSDFIGLRLRALVERRGTVEQAYRAIGVSRATLFNWFGRKTLPPGDDKVEKLRRYLGSDAAWVLDGVHSRDYVYPAHHLNSGGTATVLKEDRGLYSGGVASRIPGRRLPSTREDCENYFRSLMDAADLGTDPNAFPVIHDRLKKQFPLEEWETKESP